MPSRSGVDIRKVQIVGGSTFTVSLPKRWVEANGVSRGDGLAVLQQPDGNLLLTPATRSRESSRTTTIELEGLDPDQTQRRVVAAYLAGHDQITLHAKGRVTKEQRAIIRDMTHAIMGLEIVEETMSNVTVQELLSPGDFPLHKVFSRMHRIARNMHQDTLTAFREQDLALAEDVASRDIEVDRLEWMLTRQSNLLLSSPVLGQRMGLTAPEALSYVLAARSVERMADHAAKICQAIPALQGVDLPEDLLDAITKHAEAVHAVWDDAVAALQGQDADRADKAIRASKAIANWRAALQEHLSPLPTEAVVNLTLVEDSLDRTRGYASDIAEIATNHAYYPTAE